MHILGRLHELNAAEPRAKPEALYGAVASPSSGSVGPGPCPVRVVTRRMPCAKLCALCARVLPGCCSLEPGGGG